jgi:uncharacterized protein
MICPRCNTNLTATNTQGIEIDNCPNCKGVWLDRGELEKIIERSNSSDGYRNEGYEHHNDRHNSHDSNHDKRYGHDDHSRRKKGFLSDLFDF